MSDWPTKRGATCAWCDGPVDAFGCAGRCAESERNRLDVIVLSAVAGQQDELEQRLAAIRDVAERLLRARQPEFLDREWTIVYRLAGGER